MNDRSVALIDRRRAEARPEAATAGAEASVSPGKRGRPIARAAGPTGS
ncbi:hypothetical protein LN042_00110 [Kitasatospora sp. RB6PN24]|nr:hypothetical protein [Kitasatospora humi]MCC9305532.1 hypothetical protein [Kitasatospora humi]